MVILLFCGAPPASARNRYAATMRGRDLRLLPPVTLFVTLFTLGRMHPWAARKIAFLLPANVTRLLGEQTLAALAGSVPQPTALTHELIKAIPGRRPASARD